MRPRNLLLAGLCVMALPGAVARAGGGPIMPLSQVQPGMNCTGETVVQGTTVSSFNVHVIDIVRDPQQGARILVSVSGPAVDLTGVAEGFSGSPVYCDDGMGTARNIGAISAGIGEYGNKVALVTPIEQMLGEPVLPPSSAPRLNLPATPLQGPLTVGGVSPSVLHLVQKAGQRTGRTVIAAPSSGALASYPAQPLVPGASVGVAYSSGSVPIGAIGTVSYRDGDTVYAFGHPLDGAGRRSLLLQDAYVYYVVNDPGSALSTSYKLADLGHTLGTVTSDTPNAVIGTAGSPPPTIPLGVTARDGDTGARMSAQTQVADEAGVGFPLGTSLLDFVGPLAVTQAATDIYDGAPANESGHMCLSIVIRESRLPLSFCNRYVSSGATGGSPDLPPAVALAASDDASTAFSTIDSVQFATIHITHVLARIDVERGLREASIVSAAVPHRVRAGTLARVRLVVRNYRGSLRRIAFRVRVPRGLRGRVRVKLTSAGTPASAGSLAQSAITVLTSALGGGGGGPGGGSHPPGSIPALRRAIAGTAPYDGLRIKFPQRPAHAVYRDPSLLITGRAKLVLNVVR
jgi:hypothetical protein